MFYQDNYHNYYQIEKVGAAEDFSNLLRHGWHFISYPATNKSITELLEQAKQHLSPRQYSKLLDQLVGEPDADWQLDLATEFLLYHCHFYIYNALDGSMYCFNKPQVNVLGSNGSTLPLPDYLDAVIENFSKYRVYKMTANGDAFHVLDIYENPNSTANLDKIMLQKFNAIAKQEATAD